CEATGPVELGQHDGGNDDVPPDPVGGHQDTGDLTAAIGSRAGDGVERLAVEHDPAHDNRSTYRTARSTDCAVYFRGPTVGATETAGGAGSVVGVRDVDHHETIDVGEV